MHIILEQNKEELRNISMGDPNKKRLGKVAQEFNVSTEKIVDLLKKKNYNLENNANAKLDENMYSILVKEYAGDRKVKEEAQRKNFDMSKKNEPIAPVKPAVVEPEPVEEREVFIKSNTIEISVPIIESPKIIGKLDLDKPKAVFTNDASENSKKTAPAVDSEKPKAEKASATKKGAVDSDSKTIGDNEESLPKSKSSKAEVKSNIKSVGFLNLDTINSKTKPAKKNEEQLRNEIEKRNAVTEKIVLEEQQRQEKENVPQNITTDQPNTINSDVPTEDVYKMKIQKLEGPKIMGKLDLDTIKKPVAKSDGQSYRGEDRNKKRRKRIPQPGQPGQSGQTTQGGQPGQQNQPRPANTQQNNNNGQSQNRNNPRPADGNRPARPANTGTQQGPNNRPANTGGNTQQGPNNRPANTGGAQQGPNNRPANTGGTQQGPNNRPGGGNNYQGGSQNRGGSRPASSGTGNNRFNKNAPAKDVKKVELTDEEIQRQIKETLARLGPSGKSKASKHRRDKRQMISQKTSDQLSSDQLEKKVIKVAEFLTANELANLMSVPVTQIISICMSIGLFVSINQRLDAETITLLVDEFGFSVQFIGADTEIETEEEIDDPEDLIHRSPIVTVMGHVDHGKTSLLDYIRKANVIAGEAGGITQHIGAYEVKHESGKRITFLDTPGHEAFTAMRARGAKITDIAIIVIAADDSIMPQTKEAINHAQAADVPMIFAINKVDKPNANPEKIREGLSQMNILVEEWGGKFQCQEISAKKGINIDLLLEKVLIEAEMLELKANPKRLANGTVIESSLDKGKGYVAKVLIQNGTLKVGDTVVAGTAIGKVKAMFNERNAPLKDAGPSVPVMLLGLNAAPQAGDTFKVYKDEHEAKNIANKRAQLMREQGIRTQKHITLDEIGRRIAIGDFKELNVIVKGDVDGSVEALSDSLLKLSASQVQVNVIHKSVGSVTESDVLLASASNAIIIAFQVRPSPQARKLAEIEEIDIRTYSIIYNAINEIKDAIEGMLSPEIQEKIVCNIEVREIFNITKVGTIAGCMVLDGKINRNTKIRVIRNGIVVYSGKLASLKRFKDEVKEVFAGQDCGLDIEKYNDIQVNDIIEGYDEIEVKRTLK